MQEEENINPFSEIISGDEMTEGMAEFCRYFPDIEIKGRFVKDVGKFGIEPGRYAAMALAVSLFLAVFGLAVLVLWQGALLAIPLSLLVFALSFGFFVVLPGIELRKRSSGIEIEMPLFLRTMAMLLEMGIPFHKALEIASEEEGALQDEMKAILEEIRQGMGMQKAFACFARSFESLAVKRATSQLLSVYEVGGSGSELRRIADELLAIQRHRLKEHSARSAMFGLLFIMSSAILPTFFLVYAILGRLALGTAVSNIQMAIALLVLFPLISTAIAALSKMMTPLSAFSSGSGFDAWLILPGMIFVAGFVVFPQAQAAIVGIGLLAAGYFFYKSHRAEQRAEDIEGQLPDALLTVAGMPKSAKAERIFSAIERGGHGALSEEAGKSRRQLEMNLGVDAVLDDLWRRNPSMMLRRACSMMKQMIKTNCLDRLGSLAEDMISTFQIKRERSQMLALQKYTLIFGALLIPLILKMTLYLLESMSGLFEEAEVSSSISFASSIVPPYLIIYAVICSAVIADAEGKKSSAVLYFLALSVVSLVAFHFINL